MICWVVFWADGITNLLLLMYLLKSSILHSVKKIHMNRQKRRVFIFSSASTRTAYSVSDGLRRCSSSALSPVILETVSRGIPSSDHLQHVQPFIEVTLQFPRTLAELRHPQIDESEFIVEHPVRIDVRELHVVRSDALWFS